MRLWSCSWCWCRSRGNMMMEQLLKLSLDIRNRPFDYRWREVSDGNQFVDRVS